MIALPTAADAAAAATAAPRRAEALVLSCFMMLSHRWSHTQADELPTLVVSLQEGGVLLSIGDEEIPLTGLVAVNGTTEGGEDAAIGQ